MQTFLPYASFAESAKVLDRQRLGKQRLEAKQILMTLEGVSSGWKNHPAVKMWSGSEAALAIYGYTVCTEWRRRGYSDSLRPYFGQRLPRFDFEIPEWLGREEFHDSHKSNLLRKFPEHYRQFWPDLADSLSYVWPAEDSFTQQEASCELVTLLKEQLSSLNPERSMEQDSQISV